MEYPVLNAFSNSVRLKLLCCLSKNRKNVQELMENCGLSQSAVSQHLTKLKKAGLVENEKSGKFVYYSLTNPKTAKIAMLMNDFCKGGE
jgi:DNA-binding transcriptional ArsR family regulator